MHWHGIWHGIWRGIVYFYGTDGALLTTDGIDDDWDYNVYFAGRTVWRESVYGNSTMPPGPVSPDRLGSAVKHFPYGDEPTTTAQNREKFATYYRDEVTALDYARNRYYSSTIARFTTADPSLPFDPSNPQSFNLYAYVQGDPVNLNDPEGLDVSLPIGRGQYECTTRVYDSILSTSGFGAGNDALTNFARSDWGRMALAIWGEVRPGAAADAATNAAMMGVGFTFINRYNLRGNIADFGSASATLGAVVIRASDIWNSDGGMLDTALTGLTNVLKGSASSGDCDGLIQAIKIAAAVMAQTVGFGNAGFGAMPYVYNPVGDALYFNSEGCALWTHPYGYASVAGPILRWTGWGGAFKKLYFWGITPTPTRPVRPVSPRIPYIPSPIDRDGYGRWGRGPIPL